MFELVGFLQLLQDMHEYKFDFELKVWGEHSFGFSNSLPHKYVNICVSFAGVRSKIIQSGLKMYNISAS